MPSAVALFFLFVHFLVQVNKGEGFIPGTGYSWCVHVIFYKHSLLNVSLLDNLKILSTSLQVKVLESVCSDYKIVLYGKTTVYHWVVRSHGILILLIAAENNIRLLLLWF